MDAETSRRRPSAVPRVELIGITGIPEIKAGDELASMILRAAGRQGTPIESGDVLVVTQKIVSKAEGRVVDLKDVSPSPRAREIARESGRDSRLVELVLRESRSIVRMDAARGVIITETRHGFVCANAGIDASNVPGEDMVTLLPEDPDASARRIEGGPPYQPTFRLRSGNRLTA
jgi:coenzyme F420-0:L-glutamate ligase/coenzyme F420-1:gamma-L-glutamate ligase